MTDSAWKESLVEAAYLGTVVGAGIAAGLALGRLMSWL